MICTLLINDNTYAKHTVHYNYYIEIVDDGTYAYSVNTKTKQASIEEYLGEKRDFNVYTANKQLRRAVERELEIIGEAASRLLKLAPDIAIDNARRVVDLRNFVIHSYDRVDDSIIWGILSKNLPKLKQEVILLLETPAV
jgi:uncharacterized protein with HEPN domain